MENTIKVQNLTKNYGKSRGVEDINLSIEKGTVYGFIGPNGAGKSTTIKCIMTLINKTKGNIEILGEEVTKANSKIKENIGYLPSEIHLYDDLTVKKMFQYSASFYKKNCSSKIEELVGKLEVDTSKKIDELSLGNLKKVGIILALMHDPEIIIMDEATSGLDPLMQEKFYEILLEEKKKGKTIFFSSHILSELKKICDKVAIIKEGKIIKVDSIQNLKESNLVKVSIEAEKIEEIKQALSLENVEEKDKILNFVWKEDINKLIKLLNNYTFSRITIAEVDIEDIFMHYYE